MTKNKKVNIYINIKSNSIYCINKCYNKEAMLPHGLMLLIVIIIIIKHPADTFMEQIWNIFKV